MLANNDGNERVPLEVLQTDTVANIKALISDKTAIPTTNQELVFASSHNSIMSQISF